MPENGLACVTALVTGASRASAVASPLGLCRADDPQFQHVLAEKYPYVPPEDQASLRAAVTSASLLDALLVDVG